MVIIKCSGDLYRIHAQLKLEESLFSRDPPDHAGYMAILKQPETNGSPRYPGFFRRFCQLFTIRRNLRALVGSCIVMVAQYVLLDSLVLLFCEDLAILNFLGNS